MSQQSKFLVTLTLTDPVTGETRNFGTWDKQTGGGVDSEESAYRASGGVKVALGGSQSTDNLVLSRLYDLLRDHPQVGWLMAMCGRAEGVVTKVPTNAGYVAQPGPLKYDVKLKRCTPPEVDSESDDPALVELELTVTGVPTQG